jgi:heme o synthase
MIARLQLAKVGLCIFISSAVLFGAILADPVVTLRTLLVVGGVFFVATGAATLNSMQELGLDAKMERTKARPLPTGELTWRQAGWQAMVLFLTGLLFLIINTSDLLPVALTASAVILYNGFYTLLKKISIWAIIPGSICGALPAYIGWLACGGEGLSIAAALIFALFVLWQIPHFWLILLHYQEDYTAGNVPNLLHQFRENNLKRLFIPWIGALASIMLMFATLSYPLVNWARYGVAINALCLQGIFYYRLKYNNGSNYQLLFFMLNGALLIHMTILGIGRIIG